MTNVKNPVNKIDHHLQLLGFASVGIQKQISKWLKHNGSEWTVSRIKNLKTQFLRAFSGEPVSKDWVAWSGGLPKGTFRPLFRRGFKSRKDRKLVLSVLNSYLVFINPSKSKEEKVYQNIQRSISDKVFDFVTSQWESLSIQDNDLSRFKHIFSKELDKDNLKFRLSPGLNTAKPFVSGDNQWYKSLTLTSRKVLPTDLITCDYFTPKGSFHKEVYGGELISLFERGNKVRVIALPHAELQMALEPLHRTLNKCLSTLPEDCTFDQEQGAIFAQNALKSRKTVHSVDLSAATDRFPLKTPDGCPEKVNLSRTP